MLVYLVRHGETLWNSEQRTQGWTDIALNARGHRHARAIAQALCDTPLRAVYASDLSRAKATAQAIADRHGLEVRLDPDLRELNQGTLDGLTSEDLRRDHSPLLEEWRARAGSVKMPDGESMADLQLRAWSAIERIASAHAQGSVVVVSHNLAIVTVLCRILGIDLDNFRLLRQDVAAINVLEFGNVPQARVLRMNDTAHVHFGKRLAGMLARADDVGDFAPAAVEPDDLATILSAATRAAEAADCRVETISARELVTLVASQLLNGCPDSAPSAIGIFPADQNGLVEAVVAAVRLTANALGYKTLRLGQEAYDHLRPDPEARVVIAFGQYR